MTAPDTLPRELAELGELLREDPPRPDPTWARELDDRAAAGFPRPPRRSLRSRLPRPRVLMPALGFAASLILVVVVIGAPSDSQDLGDSSGSGGGASAPAAKETVPFQGEGSTSGGESSEGGASAQDGDAASPGPSALKGTAPPGGGDPRSDSRPARRQELSAALTLTARPRDIDKVSDGILRVADLTGGYVASSSVSSSSGGTFELRIPSRRLPRALADLSQLGHVRERTQSSQDITAQSVSARGRLTEARREREGLLRALAKADTLNETESIRARLRTVNGQIGAARTAVRAIDNRAAFANVTVTLVADRSVGASTPDEGGWTPGDALDDALRVLELTVGIALVALAIALPLGLLVGFGWLAARMAGRRRRERALDMA